MREVKQPRRAGPGAVDRPHQLGLFDALKV
jgi:hypothetical protein